MSEDFWMKLQDRYDREATRIQIADELAAIDPVEKGSLSA